MTEQRFGVLLEFCSCALVTQDVPRQLLRRHDDYLLVFADRAEAERTAERMRGLSHVVANVVRLNPEGREPASHFLKRLPPDE